VKALAWLFVLALTAQGADYGVKTRFAENKPLRFPDCELTFTGPRKVSSPAFSRGMVFYDFTVSAGGETKTVSWSSGTGDIGPALFEAGGKRFVLELSRSEGFPGWLKEDELVLWREADFRRLKK
jgi:hypothetical protein